MTMRHLPPEPMSAEGIKNITPELRKTNRFLGVGKQKRRSSTEMDARIPYANPFRKNII